MYLFGSWNNRPILQLIPWRLKWSAKPDPQVWSSRMTKKLDLRWWPTSLTYEFVPRICTTTLTIKNEQQEWPMSLTHKNDARVWPTRITRFSSLLHKLLSQRIVELFLTVCGNGIPGWNSSNELRITFFKDNFQGFWLNEHLPMATFRSCIKCLKSTSQSFLS